MPASGNSPPMTECRTISFWGDYVIGKVWSGSRKVSIIFPVRHTFEYFTELKAHKLLDTTPWNNSTFMELFQKLLTNQLT